MNSKAKYYIDKLALVKHPEGGYYKEVYRAAEYFYLPEYSIINRKIKNFSTSIYFLLVGTDKSYFHKLKSDEIWHFYDGSDIRIITIDDSGKISEIFLGKQSEKFQCTIEKDLWFAAELTDKKSFALIGCTVFPGFEFEDFILGDREQLIKKFPQHQKIIRKFTKVV